MQAEGQGKGGEGEGFTTPKTYSQLLSFYIYEVAQIACQQVAGPALENHGHGTKLSMRHGSQHC